jgi:hypothetical protein
MGRMNIFIVLAKGWPPLANVAKGRVGLKRVSGYRGLKLTKSLTGKELCDFGVVKK